MASVIDCDGESKAQEQQIIKQKMQNKMDDFLILCYLFQEAKSTILQLESATVNQLIISILILYFHFTAIEH